MSHDSKEGPFFLVFCHMKNDNLILLGKVINLTKLWTQRYKIFIDRALP